MVQVVSGPAECMDMMLYPDNAYQTQQYIQSQLGRMNSTLTGIGQKFMQGAHDLYQSIHNSDSVKMAMAIVRNITSSLHPNQIRSLETLQCLQAASPVMQRWVMAQPDLRTLYQNHRVEGYSDTYIDVHPGVKGEAHYDYRRVMNGVIFEEGGEFVSKHYMESLLETDRELTSHEQVDILKTWQIVEMYANARKADPTNPFGGEIG